MFENLEKFLNDSSIEDLYNTLNPRHKKIVDWTIKECADIEEKSNKLVPTEVFTIISSKEEPILMQLAIERSINRRRLENLDALDFDFGLRFVNEGYMPFFTENDTALFKRQGDDFDAGDMCLLEFKIGGALWLGFAEENGFFSLDGDYLGDDEDLKILGTLVNIETR
jgi:hypothetical protein